jgi:hypothetical protein
MGIPMGTLFVYDRRRGMAASIGELCGLLEPWASVEVEVAKYSGFGWWMKLVSSSGGIETA